MIKKDFKPSLKSFKKKRFCPPNVRLCLRLDYEIPATEVRKLNDNKVIETWYEINSKPENRITGQ